MSMLSNVSLPPLIVVIMLKALLLLIVVLTITWFMRRSSAAVRHLYLSAAAVLLLAMPLASLILPSWNTGLLPDPFAVKEDQAVLTPLEQSETARETLKKAPGSAAGFEKDMARHASLSSGKKAGPTWLEWVLIVWIIGAAVLLIRLIGGKLYGYWLAWRAPEIKDKGFIKKVEQAAHQLGIYRNIPIVESDRFKVPFVYGIFTPRLIMPSSARLWPSERLKTILHHEFAHIKRKDILIQFLAQVVCCVYWINPLVWILERRLFLEREHACDDMTLGQNIKASAYAGHLMEVLEEMGNKNNKNLWVITAMAEGTDFKDRILSILNPTVQRSLPKRMHWSIVIVFTLLLLLPFSALSPWTGAASSPDEGMPAASDNLSRSPDENRLAEKKADQEDKKSAEQDRDKTELSLLSEGLESSSAKLRERAAVALGELGDRRAVPALIKLLKDEDASVREHAASALRKLGDKRAVPPLIAALNDENVVVREHAASALGELDDKRAVWPLVAKLKDESAIVREHAATALRYLGDKRAVPPLIAALDDESAVVREHAAAALGYLDDGRAVQPLIDRLQKETDDEVRIHIIDALKRLRQ